MPWKRDVTVNTAISGRTGGRTLCELRLQRVPNELPALLRDDNAEASAQARALRELEAGSRGELLPPPA